MKEFNDAEFKKYHPCPMDLKIESLFRFYKFNKEHDNYLNDLFILKKLYHPKPEQLNDPFECRVDFKLPETDIEIDEIRTFLTSILIKRGYDLIEADIKVNEIMNSPQELVENIRNKFNKSLSDLRICSFTTSKESLLFWSHYADSHKGYCIEFDATKKPFSLALKVKYQNEYPIMRFPKVDYNLNEFNPLLTKSEEWIKEDEYRSIFHERAKDAYQNDGMSLFLNGDEVKNVFLGVLIGEVNREKIISFIKKSSFKPKVWQMKLAQSDFKLDLDEIII